MRTASILALLVAASSPAVADVVSLAGGGSLEGIARVSGDRVVVEVSNGTIEIPRDRVIRIVAGPTVLGVYLDRLAQLEVSCNAEALFGLADWARERGITRDVEGLLRRVIASNPDHREARERLGYVLQDGRWMTRVESMVAQGMVFDQGRWMTPQERDCIHKLEVARDRDRLKRQIRERERHMARERARDEAEAYPYPFALPPFIYPHGPRVPVASYDSASYGGDSWYDPVAAKLRSYIPANGYTPPPITR